MQVIATAGHVDHGKSTLVRALTGMEPDRWAEERRRGMTIDLGYAWTTLASGREIAFVDVPGHERFATNMLAGVGPVPAVLLVIAADEGWAAQTGEHVRALDMLGVCHGLVAVTRSDLADPAAAIDQAHEMLATTTLAGIPAVGVSGQTGAGLDELRTALETLAAGLPPADPEARVRLWVDRSFTVRGAGTVVTGTLSAGTLHRGDRLDLGGDYVTVRGLQRLGAAGRGRDRPRRVAVNLRGVAREVIRRGDALLTPEAWRLTTVVDARTSTADLPSHLVIHVGAAAVPARLRKLAPDGADGASVVRLVLDSPRRSRWVTVCCCGIPVGARWFAVRPSSTRRHRRSGVAALPRLEPRPSETEDGIPDAGAELRRRRAASRAFLRQIGVPVGDPLPHGVIAAGSWLVTDERWRGWVRELRGAIDGRPTALIDNGVARADLVRSLGLEDPQLLSAVLGACPELEESGGRVRKRGSAPVLRPDLGVAVSRLIASLEVEPFAAPEQQQLASLGLGRRELGAAAAARAILLLPGDVALLPSAPRVAEDRLRGLPQPFTLSAARQALGTTRRIAVPLLEHLDRMGITERVNGDLRKLRVPAAVA